MSSLRHGTSSMQHALSAPLPSERDALETPARAPSLMRKYEAAALLPDLTVSFRQHVAPATPLFEECASAFARGTLIQTVRGPVAIEDLLPGDYIETANGAEPVTWIGSTTYVPNALSGREASTSSLTHLTRITSDAFGLGKPAFDLMVGPGARMVVRHDKLRNLLGQGRVLAPVQDYVDGDRFLEITPAGTVQMYHLMVREHTTIEIGGVEMETYHPGKSIGQDLGQNMRALFLSMFPNLTDLNDFGQVSLTRSTRKVIEQLLDS